MKKKILLVINTLGRAGAETAMMELIRCLDPQKYEVSLYVLLNQGEMVHEIPEHVKLLNYNFDDCPVSTDEGRKRLFAFSVRQMFRHNSIWRNLGYLIFHMGRMVLQRNLQIDKLLWKIIADGTDRIKEEYDLAIAYLEGGATYYVAEHVNAKKKAAFVHIDYGQAGYNRKLDKDCYLKLNQIFTVSEEVRTAFLKVYPECEEYVAVFHNMINREHIQDKSRQDGGFSDEYDGFRILTVGRLTRQKALDISVQAMKLLKDHGKNVRWYVLGEGDQRESLRRLICKLGLEKDFLLLGNQANPYPYFRQADLYVHASRFEGKSIAIQEAQVLGCPILVSDCNGNREQVTDGVDGALCDLNAESIFRHICRLMEDNNLRESYGKAASKRVFTSVEGMQMLLKLL